MSPLSLRANQGNTLLREPLVEAVRLDKGSPVTIVDHPKQFRILIDRAADPETIAAGLTSALRENYRRGHWRRDTSGLWVTS